MKLELLSPTELMIYREAYEKGLAEGKKSLVREFHEKFGHPIKEVPAVPVFGIRELRVKLLLEEVLEFAAASGVAVTTWTEEDRELEITEESVINFSASRNPDIVEAADALADIRVVTDGANLCWGFPQEALLAEVHRSNMSKLGEDGKPIYREDGKILKGPNFTLPNVERILKQYGWKG